MDPKCSANQSVIVLDPFHHSVYCRLFAPCFLKTIFRLFIYIYLSIYIIFVFLVLNFVSQSVGVAGVSMLCLS